MKSAKSAESRLLKRGFLRCRLQGYVWSVRAKHERRQKATGRYEEDAPVGSGILERSGPDDDDF